MMMAADFHIPPWELGDRAPAEWVDRWLADNEARGDAEPTKVGGSSTTQGTGKRVTRVI